MANRQARREQRRSRRREATGTRRPAPGPQGPRRGSGLPDWLTQPFTLIVAGVAIIAIVALAAFIAVSGGGDEELAAALEDHEFPAGMANGTVLGDEDAPVHLVMYEDFQCPFCLEYTALEEPGIIEEYVATGDVSIEFRHLPILGPESTQAALASECAADQNLFWEYQNALFLHQAEAGQGSNEQLNVGRFSNDGLKEIADDVGLDRSVFDDCLESAQHLDAVQADQAEAQQLGIRGTPGFAINGQAISQPPGTIEGWRALLDSVLQSLEEGEDGDAPAEPDETQETSEGTGDPDGGDTTGDDPDAAE